jgi:hypothetical protein
MKFSQKICVGAAVIGVVLVSATYLASTPAYAATVSRICDVDISTANTADVRVGGAAIANVPAANGSGKATAANAKTWCDIVSKKLKEYNDGNDPKKNDFSCSDGRAVIKPGHLQNDHWCCDLKTGGIIPNCPGRTQTPVIFGNDAQYNVFVD